MLYNKLSIKKTSLRAGQVVLQLHPDLTCSTTGMSARACECRNAGRQCTGCYLWGRCKNRGRLMLSHATARELLGHFPPRHGSA